jgi:lysophospholipase L1-like esterase
VARLRVIALVTAAIAVLAALLLPGLPADGAQAAMPRPGAAYAVTFTMPRAARPPIRPVPPVTAVPPTASQPSGPLAGCEQKLEHAASQRGVPRVAIVGASFTAGTGPGRAGESWAVLLARLLHWDAVVYGVPGAGYVHPGAGPRGPVDVLLRRIGLGTLAPALVIVQAGHDDIGVPPQLERDRVTQAIALIRAEAPQARIALVTVFAGRKRTAAAYQTDQVIVAAAQAADPGLIIMDPLVQGWTFPRTRDGLHPTAAGDAWIARQVAGLLSQQGIRPAAPGGTGGPVICDSGIPVRPNIPVRPQPR